MYHEKYVNGNHFNWSSAAPANSPERKTAKWLEVEECDAANLKKVGEAARQKDRVIVRFLSRGRISGSCCFSAIQA